MSLAVKSCWLGTIRATSEKIGGADVDVIVPVAEVVKWGERRATRVALPMHRAPQR